MGSALGATREAAKERAFFSNVASTVSPGRKHQTQKAGEPIDGAHPQNGKDLSLHKRLIHLSEMGRHVKHGDQARQERERPGDVDNREIALLFHD